MDSSRRIERRTPRFAEPSPCSIGKQLRRQVSRAIVRENRDDALFGVFLSRGNDARGVQHRAQAHSRKDAFPAGQKPGGCVGLLLPNADDLVIDPGIQHSRNEARPQPLQTVRAGIALGEQRR